MKKLIVCCFFICYSLQATYNTIEEYTLNPTVSEQCNTLLHTLPFDPYTQWDFYKLFAKNLMLRMLPTDVIASITAMRNGNGPDVIVIHNAPVDEYIPPTPIDGKVLKAGTQFNPMAKGFVSETTLLGICSMLDAYPQATMTLQANSPLSYIHQIIPLDDEQSKKSRSSTGSRVAFEPHTEAVSLEPAIKFFELLGIRGNKNVATDLFLLADILNFIKLHLPTGKTYEWLMGELRKPQFIMRDGSDWAHVSHEQVLPIISYTAHGERIFRFNANGIRVEGDNKTAQDIVDYLIKTLQNPAFKKQCVKKFYLQKGDLLIFNNWRVMHARDSFTADPYNRRWLQRCYCISN